ncbi:MAG: hypothetical protein PVSMB4_13210 [Ktedonobacterales bacterium]
MAATTERAIDIAPAGPDGQRRQDLVGHDGDMLGWQLLGRRERTSSGALARGSDHAVSPMPWGQ